MVLSSKVAIIKYILLMVKVNASPKIASEVAKNYWEKCDKTHGDTSWKAFEFYYHNIIEIMNPVKNDAILDAACGGGELTYLFHKDGFNVKGFDSSEYLIAKAREKFGNDLFYVDDLIDMRNTQEKFTKIFLNNAFFYIHPTYYKTVLKNLCNITEDSGTVYLFDNPDYHKRDRWYKHYSLNILTFFLPVYSPYMSGFWVKTNNIKKIAINIGFSRVEKLDIRNHYRSHQILLKEEKR